MSSLNYTMKMVWYKNCALLCSRSGFSKPIKSQAYVRSSFTYLLYAVTEKTKLIGSFFSHILPIARMVLGAGKLSIEQGKGETTERQRDTLSSEMTGFIHIVKWLWKHIRSSVSSFKHKIIINNDNKNNNRLPPWIVTVIKLCHHCSFYIAGIVLCRKKKRPTYLLLPAGHSWFLFPENKKK